MKAAGLDEEEFSSHDLRKWMIWDLAQKVDEISRDRRTHRPLRQRGTIDGAADELGLTYHQMYERAQLLGLECKVDDVTARLLITIEGVEALRNEIERVRALRERSMLISEAATVLGKKRSTLQGWIQRGISR